MGITIQLAVLSALCALLSALCVLRSAFYALRSTLTIWEQVLRRALLEGRVEHSSMYAQTQRRYETADWMMSQTNSPNAMPPPADSSHLARAATKVVLHRHESVATRHVHGTWIECTNGRRSVGI